MNTTEQKNAAARGAPSKGKFSRRVLLRAAAGAGLTVVLGEALYTYPPWLSYEERARETWNTPFRKVSGLAEQMSELIRYAGLAPSGHNTQPWKFQVLGNKIRIHPDYLRRLSIVDPSDRELWISLGCALENLVIAAQFAGWSSDVVHPIGDGDYIEVALTKSLAPYTAKLFDAIPHRQNTRNTYDGRPLSPTAIKDISSVSGSSTAFPIVLTGSAEKESVIEYIRSGNESQFGDAEFIHELVSWIRFNKPEALYSQDGLYTLCSGNPQVPRWMGERFVTSATGAQQSARDVTNVRSSAGLIVIATAEDDKRHWIETGRLYERIALTFTSLNVKVAFVNQPIEVALLRSQLQSSLKLGAAKPQLLFRFGYSNAMPQSLRRPVDQMLFLSD